MESHKDRIHYLLEAYISGRADANEENELLDRLLEAEGDVELRSFILEVWNRYHPVLDKSALDWNKVFDQVMLSQELKGNSKRKNLFRMGWAAAAIIAMVMATGTYFLFFNKKEGSANLSQTEPVVHDIAPPADNKAVLTLADGTTIRIDSAGNGTLAMQGGIRIMKASQGEISYSGTQKVAGDNVLRVPKGSWPISVILSDGSKVWLNVGSILRYPVSFSGKERRVLISGEAYFEVTHQESHPFVVEHNETEVEVLGTHFNVNTYEDESAERITLLEGSVRVKKVADSRVLRPGQQAKLSNAQHTMNILDNVDVDEVIAWKDNQFKFGESTSIGTIMRQISRWYDVDIEYEGNVDQHFWGSISKDVNLLQVLKVLEATGGVRFKVEGRKVVVFPVVS